ncbi:MAG: rhomboid family intramembrane serine protease [Planctomycetota bacterium]|jgi:membrane associated rhomboid family serine protease
MFIPVQVDVLHGEKPVANSAIVATTVLAFAGQVTLGHQSAVVRAFVLDGFSPLGLVGHMLLHGGFLHIIGNMIFLWVFGNAVCAWLGNKAYPAFYLFFGLSAALAHVLFDGDPAIGASGAISGVVGLYLVLYPKNRISVFYMFYYRVGIAEIPGFVIILYWFAFDILGVVMGGQGVAYWAHIGGFVMGIASGLFLLKVLEVEEKVDFKPVQGYRPDMQPLFRRRAGTGRLTGVEKPKSRLREPNVPTRRRGHRPRPPGELQ